MVDKILLVEDDKVLAQMYQDKLSVQGFDVIGVDTGKKALTILKSYTPDIILLDIMLPGGMNGFDVLQILKKDEKLKKIPVIVLTNLDSEKNTALDLGATAYIIKSDTPLEDLVGLIKKQTKRSLF
ncbi:hypothetical protein A2954_06520 [Candidatus Roizmanbacteria bacterium RIFCSPLOWO2_01_FULL_37_12]|uniref:Response regulatory domain-containing protein n=1 Tax=Candidatus Roizmanbacteria bacterium RIFCSPLOWO2_01_FULL_37_12 TaxID=1802056 RepID=A0A1F7I9X5_9BACT|nr:MAG: hypothetical protein A2768_00725 [Candidatus Roizmanbacteria bacterium RIFCSPHIGHO2_01_FULL_37_16]OGK26838.1 MAG: hypothetical protein A3D76_05140 [Candidatus Roizmanbacteria bacterium RIFCSPHIGHO2_02_FULL_37_9b]OGK40161.1 MAG: hypothetical protein A2954_06520 [Candidatus Roizmanbacteria bacterium RIFCSPLOWO2_01_FULL_37_12]